MGLIGTPDEAEIQAAGVKPSALIKAKRFAEDLDVVGVRPLSF